jgi:hypothetical protein
MLDDAASSPQLSAVRARPSSHFSASVISSDSKPTALSLRESWSKSGQASGRQ